MSHRQDIAMIITPDTTAKIRASFPELTEELPITVIRQVFVIFDSNMKGERTQILPQGVFRTMFNEDPHTLTDWTMLTARTA